MWQVIEMTDNRIPKVIHYCWFGGSSLGEKERSCIESWRRTLPDYEIRRWDEKNFDINSCDYCREAYERKMWAFVSDYARFKILCENGGVYLDTDVEVIKSIDNLVESGPFMGFQDDFSICGSPDVGEGGNGTVAPGLGMAAYAHMPLFEEIVDYYESTHFILKNGDCDITNVVDITTGIMLHHGLSAIDGPQNVAGITIYPSDYFNPKDSWTGEIRLSRNSYMIHHFNMSWLRPSQHTERRLVSHMVRHGWKKEIAKRVSKALAIVIHLDFHRAKRHLMKVRKTRASMGSNRVDERDYC